MLTLLALAVLAIPLALHYQHPPPRNVVIGAGLTLALLLIILAAAWMAYGSGLLVCALVCFVMPRLLPVNPRSNPALQFGVLSVMSLLVSRVADVQRRHKRDLRRAAVELEQRVRERTAEAVASANEARERAELLELARDAILSLDKESRIRYWSSGAEQMYGWSKAEAIGQVSHRLLQTRFLEGLEAVERKLAESGHWEGELEHTARDGTVLRLLSRWAVRRDANGRPAGVLEINTDITERRKIEEQLRHTQKLESLGVLAGGVAHDFNNLLTGILGNASLALETMDPQNPHRKPLQEVELAAERAADLTRQLLAYAGKGQFIVRSIDLSHLVREITGLVQTSIPKTVLLKLELAEGLPVVEADPGQLQQIIMNLVINGAESIGPEGGVVVVRTSARDGCVSLEVSDTGCGMSEETMAKIFDPFFTTKFTGRGLGLSAVQGIVRAHHGELRVESAVGRGTTFTVLLPGIIK